jgi:hypothetical protein
MSELNLLTFGCAVTFIAVGGAYTFLRERYLETEIPKRPAPITKTRSATPFIEDVA